MTVERTSTNKNEDPATLTVFFSDDGKSPSPAPQKPSFTRERRAATSEEEESVPAPEDLPPTTSTSGQSHPSPTYQGSSRAHSIPIKGLKESQIWRQLLQITHAREVKPTEQEREEMRELRLEEAEAQKNRERVRGMVEERRKQQNLLKEARGEVERLKAEG